MASDKRYSVEEAAKELRTGVSTILLWQHIYSEFLSEAGQDAEKPLSQNDVHLFTYISECTETGLTREEIRKALHNRAQSRGPLFSENAFKKELTEEVKALLEEESPTPLLLARLVIQQGRIADAEERKALAMERDLALKEEQNHTLSRILTALESGGVSLSGLTPATPPAPETQTHTPEPESQIQETPFEPPEEMDDLSALIREPEPAEEPQKDQNEGSDNLWDLVQEPENVEELDDLWKLVDKEPESADLAEDNLWDLVNEAPTAAEAPEEELDNLWDLTPTTPSQEPPNNPVSPALLTEEELDNLWDLVETPAPNAAAPSQAVPPPQDPEAYKDAILKEIIALKKRQNLSASAVAAHLNSHGKPTFSGKGLWESRTIEGIFKIIEKAGPA